MEFDGYVDYKLTLRSKETIKVKDIRLEIPINKDKAKYMMGLNHEGGFRTSQWEWKWDTPKTRTCCGSGMLTGDYASNGKLKTMYVP